MKTPDFWYRSRDWRATALAPLGALYAWLTARRLANGAREKMSVPVICVGNINAGGTGKTPTAIALVEILRNLGEVPHVVSRGYGGTEAGPLRVEPARHRATRVGDEPLLMSAFADVWVAKDRAAGARAAISDGATVIVLDDGFQNPALYYDFALVTVDAARGFGNGKCIPAGPLREPALEGLKRADALVAIGSSADLDAFKLSDLPADLPHFHATLAPLQTGMDWSGKFVAFAGIGHPDKFFDTLRAEGATLVQTHALGDHEPLKPALLARLSKDAKAKGAQLVTTEKDAARLPPNWRGEVVTLPVRLQFADQEALLAILRPLFAPAVAG